MDDGMVDYHVQTKVSFRLDFDGSGELNLLALPDVQKQFAQHVKKVFEQEGMGDYISGDLDFHFNGRAGWVEYTFSCHDENEAEAESFSDYCVRCAQKKLEVFGCKIGKIDCKAEEADLSWLDALEDQLFGPRQDPPEPVPSKTSQKKGSRGKER